MKLIKYLLVAVVSLAWFAGVVIAMVVLGVSIGFRAGRGKAGEKYDCPKAHLARCWSRRFEVNRRGRRLQRLLPLGGTVRRIA